MALIPTNSVGGYSTGITMTAVIDATGNITGVTGTFTKTLTGTTATFTGLVSSTVGFSGSGTNITGLVSSFNGLTGAVTGVTVGGTNVFTALNSFTAGISASGGTFSGDIAVNGGDITTTSATATVFNTTATTLNLGGAATTLTMGATSGTASIRNATLRLGDTTNTITTNSGTLNSLIIQPYGNINLTPSTNSFGLGSATTLVVTNDQNATGQVQIEGGDLYLGTKTTNEEDYEPVNIIFEGATDNTNETTLTVVDPTADRTITFPDASGTVALTSGLVSSLSGSTYISVSGSTGAVTITNTGVQTFNGLTGAVTGVTVGGTNVFTALNSFSVGISAAGATFSAPITSTRMARHTSAAISAIKTASFTPTAAEDGTLFYIDYGGKGMNVTLEGLPIGWRAKFFNIGEGSVNFDSTTGSVAGIGVNSSSQFMVEAICISSNTYFIG